MHGVRQTQRVLVQTKTQRPGHQQSKSSRALVLVACVAEQGGKTHTHLLQKPEDEVDGLNHHLLESSTTRRHGCSCSEAREEREREKREREKRDRERRGEREEVTKTERESEVGQCAFA